MYLGCNLQSEHLCPILVDVAFKLFADEVSFDIEHYEDEGGNDREDMQADYSDPCLPLSFASFNNFRAGLSPCRVCASTELSESVGQRVLLNVSELN